MYRNQVLIKRSLMNCEILANKCVLITRLKPRGSSVFDVYKVFVISVISKHI